MQSLLSMLIIALLVWRLLAFVSGYLRGKSDAADRKTEREQKKDWARRMRGRNE